MTVQPSEERSRIMRAVRSKDTSPEIIVRKWLHANGYRYRLHSKNLPGKPDIVFPSRKKLIFVHGCFWHAHKCSRGDRQPKTNVTYWKTKIKRNAARDHEHVQELNNLGWEVLTVWECEIRPKRLADLYDKLLSFLNG